ncbi:MAG: Gfo/Idh/MocA family oxidoreductase [Rhodospirillales bacterium]|nr:Gfo/Idh/MocA family oxidoreductase [Alphaproteobacteria bacterium]MCB9986272.1 Gfo/Idh/MocA family oxidoreductase [Rhodospirillales bacterium]USO07175.1 MAG: Gfo/Idh/MocA family oxidoreductase [Rhodospirillales bacterium]
MSTTRAKNIAVIGCGYWGQNLVRSAAELGVLAAVSDSDAARAEKFGAQYAVPALSYDAVLADPSIAGVMLATPAPMHAEMALRAIQSGKHCFVEKPIAMSVTDAEAMVAAADKAGRILMVGHVLQYHPAFIALTEMIAAGRLGRVRRIYSNRLNFGKVRTEENVLWSFAPHDFSMVLALAGREPTHIQAVYSSNIADSALASTAIVHMDFGDGLDGHIHVSWLNPFKEQKLSVIGDKAMAVFDDTRGWNEKLTVYPNSVSFDANGQPVLNKGEAEFVALAESQPLKDEVAHFADCIASGAAPRTDGREGLRVLKAMRACDHAAGQKMAAAA